MTRRDYDEKRWQEEDAWHRRREARRREVVRYERYLKEKERVLEGLIERAQNAREEGESLDAVLADVVPEVERLERMFPSIEIDATAVMQDFFLVIEGPEEEGPEEEGPEEEGIFLDPLLEDIHDPSWWRR